MTFESDSLPNFPASSCLSVSIKSIPSKIHDHSAYKMCHSHIYAGIPDRAASLVFSIDQHSRIFDLKHHANDVLQRLAHEKIAPR